MRYASFGMLIALAAGCGDRQTERLPVGATAVLLEQEKFDGHESSPVVIKGVDSQGQMKAGFVDQGTPVAIVDDVDTDDDPAASSPYRIVTVHVLNGPLKGEIGEVARHSVALPDDRKAR